MIQVFAHKYKLIFIILTKKMRYCCSGPLLNIHYEYIKA